LISRIKGTLVEVGDEAAYVETGGLVYQVLIPLNSTSTLGKMVNDGKAAGSVSFYTIHYIEGGIGTGHMQPRLIGFLTEEDRNFFQILTTVKGVGVRKALRALSIPTRQIIAAIETGNRAVLVKLPEIGARTAERLITELKGKLAKFNVEPPPETAAPGADTELADAARQILMLSLQFSEPEADAIIAKVLAANKNVKTVQELLQEAFKHRTI